MLLKPALDVCRCRLDQPWMFADVAQACPRFLQILTKPTHDVCRVLPMSAVIPTRPVGRLRSEPAAHWKSCVQLLGFQLVPEIEHARMICASEVTVVWPLSGSTSVPGGSGGQGGRRRCGPTAHLISEYEAAGLTAATSHPTRDRHWPIINQRSMTRRMNAHLAKLILSRRRFYPSQQP